MQNFAAQTKQSCNPRIVHHHVICQHQIEIEIQPATVDVYFADERYIDPVNTQTRFQAVVYNAPNHSVSWQVLNINGGSGVGSIDSSGLYKAPPKGSLLNGHTDIVFAYVTADPTRRAYASVTLVGLGPEPKPDSELQIFPQVSKLYYQQGMHNDYIDSSNKVQQFRTIIKHSPPTTVKWELIGGVGSINQQGFYTAPNFGSSPATLTIRALLNNDNSVKDEAKIILLNYSWPGIAP